MWGIWDGAQKRFTFDVSFVRKEEAHSWLVDVELVQDSRYRAREIPDNWQNPSNFQ